VTHNAVYTLPATAFAWDDGPESVLLMLWIAKHAQPALFPDLNVQHEVRSYYDEFYGISLGPDQLARIFDSSPHLKACSSRARAQAEPEDQFGA
jgi:hypothetical protein